MKINFKSEVFQALLAKANKEGKSIPAVVTEILETVLIKEETNNDEQQHPKER